MLKTKQNTRQPWLPQEIYFPIDSNFPDTKNNNTILCGAMGRVCKRQVELFFSPCKLTPWRLWGLGRVVGVAGSGYGHLKCSGNLIMTMTSVTGVRGDIRIIRQQFVRRKENEFDTYTNANVFYNDIECYRFLIVWVWISGCQ